MFTVRGMDTPQNVTIEKLPEQIPDATVTDPRKALWIDYRALNGLITDDDGIRKMPVEKFAEQLGVNRKTLYDWQNTIPDFWGKVNARRIEISPNFRLNKIHETWYLKAVKGDFQHMQLWLANFDPNFRMPQQKVEHEVGNSWAALLASKQNVIEGEITNGDTPNS